VAGLETRPYLPGDHTNHFTAVFQHAIRQCTHQAGFAGAKDQRQATPGKQSTHVVSAIQVICV